MVVDDEADMRLLVRTLLSAADGFEIVAEAADGPSALEQVGRERPDAMVLDQRMPGLTGIEVARRILADRPDLPIVLFSAYLDEETQIEAEELGVRRCLAKDRVFELADVLHAALEY